MNALEEFYIELDQNVWDVKQESDVNSLQKVSEAATGLRSRQDLHLDFMLMMDLRSLLLNGKMFL